MADRNIDDLVRQAAEAELASRKAKEALAAQIEQAEAETAPVGAVVIEGDFTITPVSSTQLKTGGKSGAGVDIDALIAAKVAELEEEDDSGDEDSLPEVETLTSVQLQTAGKSGFAA